MFAPQILMFEIQTRRFNLRGDSEPAVSLVIQIICLVDSYMLWVGFDDSNLKDEHLVVTSGNLCHSWACAIPSVAVRFLKFLLDVR